MGKSKVKGQRRKEDFVELASQPTQIPAQNPANEYRVATPFPGVSLTTSTFPPPTYTHRERERESTVAGLDSSLKLRGFKI